MLRRYSLPRALFTGILAFAAIVIVCKGQAETPPQTAKAIFAGGCFWCMEPPFEKLDGVIAVDSGFSGGSEKSPTYKQVSAGTTSHAEVVQVEYDPAKISYETLLEVYWHNVDPTSADGQFCDRGPQYRPIIFYGNETEKKSAEASKAKIEQTKTFSEAIIVPIEPAGEFWPAEDYHQDFYKKEPAHYQGYRKGCGRDARLKALWGETAGH